MINKNVLTLAYMGDSVYENYVRKYLIEQGIEKVNNLQKQAVTLVSAKAQASFLKKLMDNEFLTETELSVVYRARNYKQRRHPKHTDIVTYKHSTAFEALIGYLYLTENFDRLEEIWGEIKCIYVEKTSLENI